MERPNDIRQRFEGPFGPPCTPAQVLQAESALGHPLPAILKTHYAHFNGFQGPTDTRFLYPLQTLVDTTLWLRREGVFPAFIQSAVAVGDYGVGSYWLILGDEPDTVVEWAATMEDDVYIVLQGALTDVWLAQQEWFDAAP